MKHFDELKVLGDGAFGIVTKCRDKDNNQIVAIKKMKQRYATFEECLQEKEVKSLRKIKHENVEKLLQVFRENEHLYLVFELLGDSLLKTINSRSQPFSNEEVRFIMRQIFAGLSVIHKQGFFHRDMKPDNLLWGENNVLKIADFGLAREIRSKPPYTEYISTRWYRAPEIILRHPFYNSPVDIWAAGCIMAELYMLKPIFQGTSDTDQLYKICAVLGPPTNESWPDGVKLAMKRNLILPQTSGQSLSALMPGASQEAIDLLKQIFSYDPARRPSASMALQHPFFNGPAIPPQISKASTQPAVFKQTQKTNSFLGMTNTGPSKTVPIEANKPKIQFTSPPLNNKYLTDALYAPPTAPPGVIKNPVLGLAKGYPRSALGAPMAPNTDPINDTKRNPSYMKGSLLSGLNTRPVARPGAATSFGISSFGDNGIGNSNDSDLFDDLF